MPRAPQVLEQSESERIALLEKIAKHYLGHETLDTKSIRNAVDQMEHDSSITNQTPPNATDVPPRSNGPLTHGRPSDAHRAVGELSHAGFSNRLHQQVKERLPSCELVGPHDLENEDLGHRRLKAPFLTFDRTDLPPKPIAAFLSKVYFDFAQTVSGFAQPTWTAARIDELYDADCLLNVDDSGWICTVLTILAIGTHFSHLKAGSSTVHSPLDDVNGGSEAGVGIELYRTATKLLPDVIHLANRDSARAILMLAHFALTVQDLEAARTYFVLCSVVSERDDVGSENGKITAEPSLGDFARSWERRLSILHGWPTSLPPINANGSKLEHNPLSGNKNPLEQEHYSLTDLTGWLDRISSRLCTLGSSHRSLRSRHIELLLQARKEYKQWWLEFPSSITPILQLSRPLLHLHIHYYLNLVFLGRPFIFAATDNFAKSSNATNGVLSLPFVEDAEYAAYGIIDICSMLDRCYGLSSASYVEHVSCRVAVDIMLAQSLTADRCSLFHEKLETGLALLRQMSPPRSNGYAQLSTERLNVAIRQMHSDGSCQRNSNTGRPDGSAAIEDQYENFKNWASFLKGTSSRHSAALQDPMFDSAGAPPDLADFDWNLFGDASFDLVTGGQEHMHQQFLTGTDIG
ncbi:uncharacterized protein LTR77_007659 [Saxophila tyrrhenica]|uniref:Transcription factor domain-containing protein n=1 Tax=Saxophila tyrrhenica TaxID=1690608 RepID=A0AAV9P5I3_9PEZI|nr:hypothetical protein LTR77_007659 [Saxophila tyrrhenica]